MALLAASDFKLSRYFIVTSVNVIKLRIWRINIRSLTVDVRSILDRLSHGVCRIYKHAIHSGSFIALGMSYL
jgi:hypothetical protein